MGSHSPKSSGQSDLDVQTQPSQKFTEEMLTETESRMKAGEVLDTPPALIILGQRFGLSRFESHLLLLCAAAELDTRIPAMCARVQGDINRSYPTFALGFALFDEPAWDILSPEGRLRYWKLLSVDQSDGQPLISSPLHLDLRILDYIRGLNYLDSLLAPLTSPLDIDVSESQLAPSQEAVADRIVSFLKQFSGKEGLPISTTARTG